MAFRPWYLPPDAPPDAFPDPHHAGEDGFVAIGGDLSVERLVHAYRAGIFPWYEPGVLPCWWSPDPRGVLPTDALRVPRRLLRTLRATDLELTWNRAFRDVMEHCAHRPGTGTWILPEMVDAYDSLHRAGLAHSLEVWRSGRLVGGVYGVQIGAVCAAESKFHRERDMSKVALVAWIATLHAVGVELCDVQFRTDHLAQFGVVDWPRTRYLERLAELRDRRVDLTRATVVRP
ncbi:MAG: leucyl/phenylalanyl-tRNA--protein transferase [Planctomycetes bacterium]|nr:leucyl/phenylalanyl-tRNA--protein transferase [Planctomycetota bacterium]